MALREQGRARLGVLEHTGLKNASLLCNKESVRPGRDPSHVLFL